MAITKLNLNEVNSLGFEMELQGADQSAACVRFCVVTEDRELSFPGVYSGNDINFKIPKLVDQIKSGIYECRLEVIVGDNYFAPIQETIEFVQPVTVSEARIIAKADKEKPRISINSIKVRTNEEKETEATSETILESIKVLSTANIPDGEQRAIEFKDGHLNIDPLTAARLLDMRGDLTESQQTDFDNLIITKAGYHKIAELVKKKYK